MVWHVHRSYWPGKVLTGVFARGFSGFLGLLSLIHELILAAHNSGEVPINMACDLSAFNNSSFSVPVNRTQACAIFNSMITKQEIWMSKTHKSLKVCGRLLVYVLGMTLNFHVTGSFLYWCVMRPASQRFFVHSCIQLQILIISYLATFLGTNSLSVLMCRKAVNQSIAFWHIKTTILVYHMGVKWILMKYIVIWWKRMCPLRDGPLMQGNRKSVMFHVS